MLFNYLFVIIIIFPPFRFVEDMNSSRYPFTSELHYIHLTFYLIFLYHSNTLLPFHTARLKQRPHARAPFQIPTQPAPRMHQSQVVHNITNDMGRLNTSAQPRVNTVQSRRLVVFELISVPLQLTSSVCSGLD